MKHETLKDITLATAGIFQASKLVHLLATTGKMNETAYTTSINSLTKIDAENTLAVFDSPENLSIGFQEILTVFSHKKKANPIVSRYVFSLILLHKQLMKNTEIQAELKQRVQHIVRQTSYFSSTHETVIANLADIYLNTISHLKYRIQLIGKAEFLHNEMILRKIRALLLAGIRACVLWQQVGGRKWHLFFMRTNILKCMLEMTTHPKEI